MSLGRAIKGKWSGLAVLALLFVLSLIAARGAWYSIAAEATRDPEQSHIFLALPVVLWLAYLQRARLHRYKLEPSLVGPVVIVLGWALSVYGFRIGIDLFWHVGGIAVVIGSIISVTGTRIVRILLPSLIGLGFLLPVPGRIRGPVAGWLQEVSARIAEFGLDLFSVPVTLAGNVLTVNGKDVLIAEACNGMRMVSALALIAFAFMFSVPMRNSVRLGILLISPIVALLVNVLRLVPTALMYGYTEADTAALFHDLSGWVVLGVAILILWAFLAILRWIEVPIAPYAVTEIGEG